MLTPAASELATTPIGTGICQGYDAFAFFSLKSFARINSVRGGPSSILGLNGEEFDYSLCDTPWKLGNNKFRSHNMVGKTYNDGTCKIAKGNVPTTNTAYFVVDGKCEYNFSGADFHGLDYKNGTNHGFVVTWSSEEQCAADSTKKFEVVLTAECKNSTNTPLRIAKTNSCAQAISFSGHSGCPTATLEVDKYAELLAPYVGFIIIFVGLVMVFFGSRFIQLLGAFLVGLLITGVVFGIGFNFLPPHHTKLWVLILLLLVGIAFGVLGAKLAWNFIKNWVVSIMAAAAVAVMVLMILGVANVTNLYIKMAALFVGMLSGGFIGKKLNKLIKTFGTAFIGSFLVVRGVSFFLGGWPGDQVSEMHKYDKAIFAYLGGFIALAVAGTLVQLRMIRDEDVDEDEDDAFKGEDEDRTCGCF